MIEKEKGMRTCKTCKGTGLGRLRPNEPCFTCEGAKELPQPNYQDILTRITTSRGASEGKRLLRKSKPDDDGMCGRRAYYVWRNARFHGGADVTMPCLAQLLCDGDPWIDELETYSSQVAKAAFGTDLAAAARWGGLLGIPGGQRLQQEIPMGLLPATAYEGGPAMADEKPIEESEELR